jgi:uncharacterized protein (TIGR01319 family)
MLFSPTPIPHSPSPLFDVLVAEIGSTTTLVNAFCGIDSGEPRFWGQGQAATSVAEGDVRIGLRGAIDDLCRKKGIESLEYGEMLATSSAAGGLKMTVHGLVYDMTAKAAREAALGAGAVLKMVTAGLLRESDLAQLEALRPNIIMIAGGVDHGERETALANARRIRELELNIPVIYAGNIDNQAEIKKIFDGGGGTASGSGGGAPYIVENVYPRIDCLNVEPARKVIQAVFEEHIVHAPGMEHIRELVGGPIIPTPGAVMEAAKLLYEAPAFGDLMVLDVGGATTDVHSVTSGSEEISRMLMAPEPLAKRTVEGDLGVFVNRMNLIELIGKPELEARIGFPLDGVLESYRAIPQTEHEIRFVEALTAEAVRLAFARHAGALRHVYGPEGRSTLAEGKDLTQIQYIIGTGGALTRLPHRLELLRSITKQDKRGLLLSPPESAAILVDNDYIMASLGVLSKAHPEAALHLLTKSFYQ